MRLKAIVGGPDGLSIALRAPSYTTLLHQKSIVSTVRQLGAAVRTPIGCAPKVRY